VLPRLLAGILEQDQGLYDYRLPYSAVDNIHAHVCGCMQQLQVNEKAEEQHVYIPTNASLWKRVRDGHRKPLHSAALPHYWTLAWSTVCCTAQQIVVCSRP
jgi:hypothetical protein